MVIVYILIVLFVFLGLYNILLTILKIPDYGESKITLFLKLFKKKKQKTGLERYSHLTHEIAKVLKLPNNIKEKLQEKLLVADITSTPELFISNLINRSLQYILCGILMLPFYNMLAVIFFVMSITSFINGYQSIDREIKIKTEKIEREIPKFLDFMTNSFKFQKNVKQSLKSYEQIASDYFRPNLQITIADMSTGNYVNALKRLDSRVNSYQLSKVIRAIIQVVNGEENTQYLRNLYRESASTEYEHIKLEADKKLDKISFYSKIILICIITIIFTVIGFMLFKNFNRMSGMY